MPDRHINKYRLSQTAYVFTGSVTIGHSADTNFYACFSRRRIRLQADVIVNRIVKTLLAPEVSLCRLTGNVAEQELNLI